MRHFRHATDRRVEQGALWKRLGVAMVIGAVFLALAGGPVWAGNEKGARKCADGVDNDGDGLIDAADPDCAGGGDGGGGEETGPFHIVIDWDGAITDYVINSATIECKSAYCDLRSSDPFTFKIPESYWGQWTLSEARECFGGSLDHGMDAEVSGISFMARDHHGSVDHWDVSADYTASFIGTTALGLHHTDFQGDCIGSCADLPPPVGSTNTYDMGYLTRAQRGSKTKRLGGEACTCAWEDCAIFPNDVTVQIEGLP